VEALRPPLPAVCGLGPGPPGGRAAAADRVGQLVSWCVPAACSPAFTGFAEQRGLIVHVDQSSAPAKITCVTRPRWHRPLAEL